DVEPMYIGEEDGVEEEINPHAFIDPVVGMKMAEAMRDALIEVDPEHEKEYQKRANEYLNRLEEIAQEYEEKISDIPKEDRVLVTSERAFQYLDRKSTRLNSSHVSISYAVFCLKKKT